MQILTLNIRSISKNFSEFEVFLSRLNLPCDMYILTETWNSKILNFPKLNNYETHFTRNNRNQNDGVVAYIKQGIGCSVKELSLIDATGLLIEMNEGTVVICVYRSPSHRNLDNFLNSLDKLLRTFSKYTNILFIGDINIDIKLNNEDHNSFNYLNLLATYGLIAGHLYPTRDQNCIDHVMIKARNLATTIVINSLVTDHCPVLTRINLEHKTEQVRHLTNKKVNNEAVLDKLRTTDFSKLLNSQDADWTSSNLVNIFNNLILNNTIQILSPRKIICLKPWITPGLVRCIKNRDRMHLKCKKDPKNIILSTTYSRYKKKLQ